MHQDSVPIALFLPTLDGGGAERAFINLARGMAERGQTVDLVVADASGPFRSEIPDDVRLVDLKARRLLHALPGLVRYLNDRNPRRVYTALEEAGLLALLARKLAKSPVEVIPSIRNRLTEEAKSRGIKRRAILGLARTFFKFADGMTAVSEGVAKDAAQALNIPVETITVVRNPTIVPELFEQAQASVSDPWFDTEAPPVVMACGRLSVQKDYPTLIQAFATLRKKRAAHLLILGEGPKRSELEQLVSDLSIEHDVSMPGFDPNPFRYMARCKVFVLSSVFEGSPNVLVQALACGAAVVSTDCPSGPSEIVQGIQHATLVPVGDVDAMSKAIEKFLDLPSSKNQKQDMASYHYLTAARQYLSV